MRMMLRRHLAVLAVVPLLSGCSLALDWQPDYLACAGTACNAGFSCLPETVGTPHGCVRDGSLRGGAVCVLDQQCQGDNLCAAGVCRRPCATLYHSATCGTAEICDQARNASGPACLPSDGCVPGGTCWDAEQGAGVCVAFSDSVQRCMPACEPSEDVCPTGTLCRAQGLIGHQEWVCVPQAAGALP